ncbi:MAG TPA: hypothetical protein VFA57_05040 [Pseudolabrys sp.]|jgi:hypothetical protein|nr:hypothetical protein [Pseudolabrys sp.]
MAYVSSAAASHGLASAAAPRLKRNFLLRLLDAVEETNRHRAEQEVARYLGGHGGKFTDESEREIGRRFLHQ